MERFTAIITRTVQETPQVMTLYFTVSGGVLPYVAGQYITVFFDHTNIKSGKAYSLSSSPSDNEMSITVKRIGLFSGLLCSLKRGDELRISRPYGFFNTNTHKPIIAIAAGVGISPIWSMIRDEDVIARRPIKLLLSNKTRNDIVFRDAIAAYAERHHHIDVRHFITREASELHHHITRRIDALKDIADHELEHMFYVCGSSGFVGSIWRQLQERGVHEDSIATETFFEA